MKKNILAKLSPFHFLMLLIAGIINAIGVTLFIAPVQLYDSCISGTSILLSQLTPDYLSLSFFLILLNIPLLLFGFKRQGAVFSIYAIFTVCVYSVAAWLITDVLPIDVSIASPLAGTDLFLCALFGGIISGVGSGLAIRYGGAMDGIEVMAVIFSKRLGITVGTFVMIYNMMPGSKGQKAVHACMIRLLNLGPAKHEEAAIYAVNQRISNVYRIAGAALQRSNS